MSVCILLAWKRSRRREWRKLGRIGSVRSGPLGGGIFRLPARADGMPEDRLLGGGSVGSFVVRGRATWWSWARRKIPTRAKRA